MSLVIIADDLSGAAETAGAFAALTGGVIEVRLAGASGVLTGPVAVDTHSRAATPDEAYSAVASVLTEVASETLVYKKIDSLLRGNIPVELDAILDSGRRVVIASAVPRVGRTVHGGVVHVDAVALHRTAAWDAEADTAPTGIPELLGEICEVIALDVVRSPALHSAVRSALDRGAVPVCDADSQPDLDAIARVILALDGPVAAVGAGGLARSLAGLLRLESAEQNRSDTVERVCVVVGSRSPAARAQVEELVSRGVPRIDLHPDGVIELGSGDCVVTLSPVAAWTEASVAAVLRALADEVRRTGAGLLLTGGSTARAVLEGLEVDRIYVQRELEDGVVLSVTAHGVAVATKPGSFGDDECLARTVDAMRGRT